MEVNYYLPNTNSSGCFFLSFQLNYNYYESNEFTENCNFKINDFLFPKTVRYDPEWKIIYHFGKYYVIIINVWRTAALISGRICKCGFRRRHVHLPGGFFCYRNAVHLQQQSKNFWKKKTITTFKTEFQFLILHFLFSLLVCLFIISLFNTTTNFIHQVNKIICSQVTCKFEWNFTLHIFLNFYIFNFLFKHIVFLNLNIFESKYLLIVKKNVLVLCLNILEI